MPARLAMIVLQKQMLMGLNGQFYIGGMFRGENKTMFKEIRKVNF